MYSIISLIHRPTFDGSLYMVIAEQSKALPIGFDSMTKKLFEKVVTIRICEYL